MQYENIELFKKKIQRNLLFVLGNSKEFLKMSYLFYDIGILHVKWNICIFNIFELYCILLHFIAFTIVQISLTLFNTIQTKKHSYCQIYLEIIS